MATPARVDAVAVIGNGIIGHGVAQVFATAGMPVRLVGRRGASLDAAIGKIRESLNRFEAHGLLTATAAGAALERISTATDLDLDAAGGVDLVIEAVTEASRSSTRSSRGWTGSVHPRPCSPRPAASPPAGWWLASCVGSGSSPPTSGIRRS